MHVLSEYTQHSVLVLLLNTDAHITLAFHSVLTVPASDHVVQEHVFEVRSAVHALYYQ